MGCWAVWAEALHTMASPRVLDLDPSEAGWVEVSAGKGVYASAWVGIYKCEYVWVGAEV